MVEKVIIMGAAGRDFHNFNIYFRDNPRYQVVAFTATQIPDIDGRCYPAELAGKLYPKGINIYPAEQLSELIHQHKADLVAFCYSDILHTEVMHQASSVMSQGADFMLIGATYTMLKSSKPIVSVCAVRTGCGKSQTTREVCRILSEQGQKVIVIRHPMPYGDLLAQIVQRFGCYEDFEKHKCTIEEREEYEPLVEKGIVVYAGVDYEQIIRQAEQEADVVIWDGGNNDTPFYRPDVHIVLLDPHRAGHELLYYPGETNLLMADIALINKANTAEPDQIQQVLSNIKKYAPQAEIIIANSAVTVADPQAIAGKRVLVIEDGPTLTHGGMTFGAGIIAARQYQAADIIEPRHFAKGTIKETFKRYPHITNVLPAMGYSKQQITDMEKTINDCDCDLVLSATPIDLPKLVTINKPIVRVRYEYEDHGSPTLKDVLLSQLQPTIV